MAPEEKFYITASSKGNIGGKSKHPTAGDLTNAQFDALEVLAETQGRKITEYALYQERDGSIVAFDAFDEEHWLGV